MVSFVDTNATRTRIYIPGEWIQIPRDQEMLEYPIPESSETKLDLVKTGGFVPAIVGRLE